MRIRTKTKFPKIDWNAVDITPILTAIAGDCGVIIKKRIAQGDVTPKLKASTIRQKRRKGTRGNPETPLLDSGLLMDNIKGRKIKRNVAEVYIENKVYGNQSYRGKTKKGKASWRKASRGKERIAKKTRAGAYRRLPTTNEVAYIHNKGVGKQKKREFFFVNRNEYDRIARIRFGQGLDQALKRAGIV